MSSLACSRTPTYLDHVSDARSANDSDYVASRLNLATFDLLWYLPEGSSPCLARSINLLAAKHINEQYGVYHICIQKAQSSVQGHVTHLFRF